METSIQSYFNCVSDPRVESRCAHLLEDILFIALCTLLSNGEDFEDMVEFGHQRLDWLSEVLSLPNGIPSHDTFNRVLQLIDPEELRLCLAQDAQVLIDSVSDKFVVFDGKKIKGASPRSRGNQGLFILSAWVGENRLCIGQQKVDNKSNEIKAIPQLIDLLELEGSVVSIDAIGCQSEIAVKILDAKADYLLALKRNQGSLFEEVHDEFRWESVQAIDQKWEYAHGRYEERRSQILKASEILSPQTLDKWKGVQTIVRIEAQRRIEDTTTTHTRYYISSQTKDCSYYNDTVRAHWGIENHLHWHLDVTFNEDASRSRKKNAPQNLNVLRKMALHRVSRMTDKISMKKRRFRASMNQEYLQKILGMEV